MRNFILPIALIFALSCGHQGKPIPDGSFDFSPFYLVTNGLNFPSKALIKDCLSTPSLACYTTVKRVQVAKQELLSRPRKDALALVTRAIEQECIQPKWLDNTPSVAQCFGAFTAIYYFNTTDEDDDILRTLNKIDTATLEALLSIKRSWLTNRQDSRPWQAFAQQKLNTPYQELFNEYLSIKQPKFGLQLLDD